jgi:ribonucleoside-diphosphate reductase alpha chain
LVQDEIISIEYIGLKETYDLELEKENLFWCEGFYVHNSGRRGALMLTISVHHPDIITFVTIKNDPLKVTGANISVRLTREFMDAVKNDSEYELRFPVDSNTPKFSKMVKAKDVWDQIISSAWERAEPGLLMWDNVTENTPADCYERFKSRGTNPCSELNLSELDSCRLMAINLYSYVKDPFTKNAKFDFDLFSTHVQILQRLMDDMVDLESEKIDKIIDKINSDPEPIDVKRDELEMWKVIKKNNEEGRRTGSGITALGDMLAALNIGYGTDESINIVEDVYRVLKLSCYKSSVEMSKELGSFYGYNSDLEKDCPFIKRIAEEDPSLYEDMVKHGRRNVSLITTAPTGSLSILTQTSSGVEPVFMLSYKRRKKVGPEDNETRVDFVDDSGDRWIEFDIFHPKLKEWMKITGNEDIKESPWYGHCAEEIDWIKRVEMQAAAQRHTCHSISATVNLPEDISKETVKKIYETAFDKGCKGITVYRKNCRSGVLVDNSQKLENSITKNHATKRVPVLNGDVHHLSVKGEKYYVVVGMLNGDPYEVFTGLKIDENKEPIIPKRVKCGSISKKSRGNYLL